jgi:pyruvate dehydrogenase E2 component (dihydrolipoamide acetyltransferase)
MADVTMPQLGETVTEGTITKWFKQVGDTIKADEPLFEVSTDKVDTEVPAPVAGVLTEIRAAEGDLVQVGGVIAVIGEAGAAPAAAPAAAAPAPAAAPAAAAPAPAPAAAAPVAPPAPPAPAPVAAPAPAAAAPVAPAPPVAPAAPAPVAPAAVAVDSVTDNRLLSPVVRKLVNEYGLNPAAITGTGAGGRITREDVLNHIDSNGSSAAPAAASAPAAAAPASLPAVATVAAVASMPAPAPSAPAVLAGERDDTVALSKIRRLTGAHMVNSLATAPHAFSVVEVDYANVDATRAKVKASWKEAEGFSLTYLPFISRAIVDAIAAFPHMNASVGADELIVHKFIDLGIAVDLDYTGLLVPVVRDAENKRLRALAREINDLANRARNRKLSPDEISGGTFTISNNGSAGSVLTSAIINQPQVAIISTDAIKRRPVVVDVPGGGESIAIHSVGNIAMSWDHRAFDGAYAAGFLVKIKDILENRDWSAEL